MIISSFKKKICVMLSLMLFAFAGSPAYAAKRDAYDITTDIVYAYKTKELKALGEINRNLDELEKTDSELGNVWRRLMSYWIFANTDQEANVSSIPNGLPDDNSLCFIVLGFQLNSDGTMADQLKDRCERALECAEKFPNAYIAVTGGGTAENITSVTEAGLMEEWLKKNGIDAKRIIREDRSQTTVENAEFLGEIIIEQYPEITSAVIVTSDYHVPQGCLCFREYFLLSEYKNNSRPVTVLTNVACKTEGFYTPENVKAQALDVWSMAEYMHSNDIE